MILKRSQPTRAVTHAICILAWLASAATVRAAPPKLPHASPEQAGMSAQKLDEIDAAVAAGIAEGQMPGGVAGHSGLFSAAEELAVYAQMLLNRGEYAGTRVMSPETVAAMTAPEEVPGGGLRALGWDVRSGYSSNRGQGFSKTAFGHGGFTGTSLWVDPELELIMIFLSNRLHPDGKGNVNPLAGRIGTIAAAAISPSGRAH